MTVSQCEQYITTLTSQHYRDKIKVRRTALLNDRSVCTKGQLIQIALLNFDMIYDKGNPVIDYSTINENKLWIFHSPVATFKPHKEPQPLDSMILLGEF